MAKQVDALGVQRCLVFGDGHLAQRIVELLTSRRDVVEHRARGTDLDPTFATSIWDRVFLVDDADERNLQALLAVWSLRDDLDVVVSLYNENIAPALRAGHPGVKILNPARIAAPAFLEAVAQVASRTASGRLRRPSAAQRKHPSRDPLLRWLLAGFLGVLVLSTVFFHEAEGFQWIDSLYFVIVTAATVGYGDLNLAHSAALSKVVGMALILCSTVFVWAIFSLTTQHMLARREQWALGRRTYTLKNHIVLCGLGRLGSFIANDLIAKDERLIVIESEKAISSIGLLRARGIDVYVGNARIPQVLQDVGVARAKALIAVVNDDFDNLEIGLNAQSLNPSLGLVLRMFDGATVERVRRSLNIQQTFSLSALAAPVFVDA